MITDQVETENAAISKFDTQSDVCQKTGKFINTNRGYKTDYTRNILPSSFHGAILRFPMQLCDFFYKLRLFLYRVVYSLYAS